MNESYVLFKKRAATCLHVFFLEPTGNIYIYIYIFATYGYFYLKIY